MIYPETTNYLKGIAVISVLVSHYSIFYFHSSRSYAYSIVSIFFVLSGAGIYLSLEKDFARLEKKVACLRYFYKRFIRIYPLYWLAYFIILIELYFLNQLPDLNPSSLITAVLGGPTNPRGIFWFVTAILQCYLFAPLIFLMIKKVGTLAWLGIVISLMGFFLPLSSALNLKLVNQTAIDLVNYKNLFLANVLLFSLGMLIPPLLKISGGRFNSSLIWAGVTVIFTTLTVWTDTSSPSEPLIPLFMISSFLFCLGAIAINPKLPFSGIVTLAGRNSYSLYLFHQGFFILLFAVGIIKENSITAVIFTLAIFPLFLAICSGLEALSVRLRSFLIDRHVESSDFDRNYSIATEDGLNS